DDVSKQRGIIANINADEDVVLEDAKNVAVDAKDVVTAAITTITAADVPIPAATTAAAAPTLTVAPSRRRKGVVIRDPKETITPSTVIHYEAKSKDKSKGILVEEPKPLKKQAQIKQDEKYARELEAELNKNIDWDEVIDHVQRRQKEDNAVKRYQALKRKPQTEAQAKKNMMLYLKIVAAVWSLVKERFATTKPKNFFDNFLLITLGAMFEKPDIHAQIWKNQKSV
nr:hypothetical protein [Tanacetum cinerariifolium]